MAPKWRVGWTDERDAELRTMVAKQMSNRAMAEQLGTHHMTVIRRIRELGLTVENCTVAPPTPKHIVDFRRARRGFVVPADLEMDYVALLKTGIPIAEACRRLGINTHQPSQRG